MDVVFDTSSNNLLCLGMFQVIKLLSSSHHFLFLNKKEKVFVHFFLAKRCIIIGHPSCHPFASTYNHVPASSMSFVNAGMQMTPLAFFSHQKEEGKKLLSSN